MPDPTAPKYIDANGLTPGKKGYKPPPEHVAAMARGRAAAAAARAQGKASGKAARKGGRGPRPVQERAPVRTTLVGAPAQRKVAELVEFAIGSSEMVAMWVLHQTVASEVRLAKDVTPEMLEPDQRQRYETLRAAHAQLRKDLELDKLEKWEQAYLASALTDEAFRYPRVKAWLIRIADMADRTTLPMVLMLIAAPRLARHGVVPNELVDLLAGARESAKRQTPVSLGGRPAHRANRGDGVGENDAGSGDAGDAPLRSGLPGQAGRHTMDGVHKDSAGAAAD